MEPQVRYTRSGDGTRIAMWVLGSGRPPLVNPHSIWFTSMESFWHVPQEREGVERLARNRTVVRYDNRGHGLSQRDITDFSLEARVADVAAVIAQVALFPVDLIAAGNAAPAALAYAAADPDKVRRLVIWNGLARGRDFRSTQPVYEAIDTLKNVDWRFYIRSLAAFTFGWNEVGLKVGETSVQSVAPETFEAAMQAMNDYDVTEVLSEIRCPTLVMHRRSFIHDRLLSSQFLASTIPNSRLVLYDSEYLLAFSPESLDIIERFLDEEEPGVAFAADEASAGHPKLAEQPGMTAILFADIADSTALTERLGDAAFRAKARELDDALRTLIRAHAGTPIEGKLLGDGVLAVFTSARQAIEAALACGAAGNNVGLALHLGLHAGDVIREDNNVYGGAVNIAARISGLSNPGEVLVSETVRSLARTSAGVRFEDRGEQSLKGVGEAVRVWAVVKGESSA